MRLKKIRLVGFKSFVDATNVNFPTQMTCVVGPNGCGKSNTIDAVRWVLGESSAKQLRGDDMTDVIFNGSTNRKEISKASVELVFENTQGRIHGSLADRSEISIKREVTRSRTNTYYLNGEKCRKKDITQIFLGTGLGARSYSIIEQGMISRLIESKPQELRVFLEEAAGISKYKERRRDTENRIKNTKLNLERLNDVVHEIGKSLERLRKQSTAAARYKELKSEERTLKQQLALCRFQKFNTLTDSFKQIISQTQIELEKVRAEQTSAETITVQLKSDLLNKQDLHEEAQKSFYTFANELSQIEQQIKYTEQNDKKLASNIQQLEKTISELSLSLDTENTDLRLTEETINKIKPSVEEALEVNDQTSEQLFESEQKHELAERTWRKNYELSNTLEKEIIQSNSKIDSLKNSLTGISERISELNFQQTRAQEEIEQANTSSLSDKLDRLAKNKTETAEKLHAEKQKHTELQSKTEKQNRSVKHVESIIQKKSSELHSLKYLQQQADLIEKESFDWLNQTGITPKPLLKELNVKAGWEKAFECIASLLGNPSIVESTPDLFSINNISVISELTKTKVENSLGSKLHNESIPAVFNIISINPHQKDKIWVTEEGLIGYNGWQKVGNNSEHSGYFSRKNEIDKLTLELNELKQEEDELLKHSEKLFELTKQINNETRQTELEFNKINIEVAQTLTELKFHSEKQKNAQAASEEREKNKQDLERKKDDTLELIEQLEENVYNTTTQHENACAKSEDAENEKRTCNEQLNQLKVTFANSTRLLNESNLELNNELNKASSLKRNINKTAEMLERQNDELNKLINESNSPKDGIPILKQKLQDCLSNHKETESRMILAKETTEEIQQKISELEKGQYSFKNELDRINQSINDNKIELEKSRMSADSQLEALRELNYPSNKIFEHSVTKSEESIIIETENVGKKLSNLGAVNLTAIDEYEKESERKKYLDEQNEDLVGALDVLERTIAQIDKETRAKFKETFEQVNAGLQDLFPKVFGGGGAYLELTDSNLLEAGVNIMARPPGKKNSTIHLLSGGEKALTALSLVFSIFKLNPSPFCMLDEVDAPLDDVNVGRFCKLVQEMSETVQFIYISHNKVAMEMAHQLAGVTMNEPGVSRLVSVDIEQATQWTQ